MNLKATAIGILTGVLISSLAAAQNQPLPKPVAPPSPNPGSTVPPERNGNNALPPGRTSVEHNGSADAALAPFVDSQTIGVVRIDLKDMDLPAIRDWLSRAVEDLRNTHKEVERARQDVHQELTKAFDRIDKFRSAGADRLYMVFSLSDLTEDHPPFIVVPLRSGADPKAVEEALPQFGDMGDTKPIAHTLGNAVVFAAPATFDRLKAATPAGRPDLSLAFDSAGKAQMRIALIPQEGARKAVEDAVTNLPDELGGGSIKSVSRGLSWTSIAVSLPPDPSLKIVIQSTDAREAATLNDIINRAITWAAQRKTGPPEELALTNLLAGLKPKLAGDRITIDLSADDTGKLATAMAGVLIQSHNAATSVRVANNLRQLCIGITLYANDHQGAMPKTLGPDVQKYLGPNAQQLWVDPLRPNQKEPYVYLKLADKLSDVKEPSSAVMLYENHSTWDDGINVAFADNHVEWITDEKQFKSMLTQTKKANPGATEMPQ